MLRLIDGSLVNYIIQNILKLFENKVDKEDGKQLSSYDYTLDDKNKLTNIENNATNNTIIIKNWSSDDIT